MYNIIMCTFIGIIFVSTPDDDEPGRPNTPDSDEDLEMDGDEVDDD